MTLPLTKDGIMTIWISFTIN